MDVSLFVYMSEVGMEGFGIEHYLNYFQVICQKSLSNLLSEIICNDPLAG